MHGFPTTRVLKHGRTTGWTAGFVAEIFSDCQREEGVITKEICVIDLPLAYPDSTFSAKGDSGSVVIDTKSRIVGVVHGGGTRLSGGKRMSYVTPIEYLLEEFERALGCSVEINIE